MSQAGVLSGGSGGGGGTGILDITGNSGGAVGADGANNINLLGSGTITVTGNPGTNTLTISQSGTLSTLTGNSGGAISPTAGNINTVGTGSITISGAGSTLTTQLTGLTNHSLLVGAGTATITNLGVATNGQLPIGSTGANPVLGNITSTGGTITVTNGAGTINLEVITGGFAWVDVTGATQTIAVQTGYITDHTNVTYTLPATANLGDEFKIVGKLGITTVAQNANQQILMGTGSSTVGTGGNVVGTNVGDCGTFRCITSGASTVWRAESFIGNWTIT